MIYYKRQRHSKRKSFFSISAGRSPRLTSSYEKSLQFVRTEFLKLDPPTFECFSDFYEKKYGDGPNQYLRRTYTRWKSGETKMAGQTEHRILSCVPPFLDKNKQFILLSFQIPEVIKQQKECLKLRSVRSSELEKTYCDLARGFVERQYNLDWFIKDIFPSEEINEFINVFRYTMIDCLRQSYENIHQDLLMMNDLKPEFNGSLDVSYYISLLECLLDIDVCPPPGPTHLYISMSEPSLVTQFREQYRSILLDHVLAQSKAEAIGNASSQVAQADLQTMVSKLRQTKSDQEYDSILEVHGHGGKIRFNLQKKNLLRLRYAIAQETIKLCFTVGISSVIVIWLCVKGLWPLLLYFGMIPLGIISLIWDKLKKLKSEVNEYERKRTTRFTTS